MKNYTGIQDLTNRYAEKKGITKKDAEEIVKAMVEVIEDELKDPNKDGIQIIGSITLKKVIRKGRMGRNPKNPAQAIEIPTRIGIKTELGKRLNKEING